MGHRTYTISQLAEEFDVTTRTIRFYEAEGLLAPTRDGQNRIYCDEDRVKLKLIQRGKRLGFSLAESRGLIEMYEPGTSNTKQINALITKINERHEQLKRQLEDIAILQHELDEAKQRCLDALECHPDSRPSSEKKPA